MRWAEIEGVAYWSLFVAAFLGVAVWESFRSGRPLTVPASRRWGRHGALFAAGGLLSAAVLRVNPVFTAAMVAHSRFGVLNQAWIPLTGRFALTILLLDLVKYAVHRAHHAVPWLWRVHLIHHSDPDFDVSTAGRAHPVEMLLTQGCTLTVIALLAPPPAAVLTAELLACFQSFFEHANASLPPWIEQRLRRVIITPDVHRIHHSREVWDQSRNLGEIFPWWDQLLGTHSAKLRQGERNWTPGLEGLGTEDPMRLRFLLTRPLHAPPAAE